MAYTPKIHSGMQNQTSQGGPLGDIRHGISKTRAAAPIAVGCHHVIIRNGQAQVIKGMSRTASHPLSDEPNAPVADLFTPAQKRLTRVKTTFGNEFDHDRGLVGDSQSHAGEASRILKNAGRLGRAK
jgi:hypothetical protein